MKRVPLSPSNVSATNAAETACDVLERACRGGAGVLLRFVADGVCIVVAVDDAAPQLSQAFDVIKGARDAQADEAEIAALTEGPVQ